MSTVPAILRAADLPGAPSGPLAGLRFVVKDVIDVAGIPTTAGSPAWASSHPTPRESAPVVDALLAAGASLVGKAISDELAFSLNGTNPHYGTPRNPAAVGRIPGGSSSGSASAVAAGECDFALGTDTGGSVRIPASYCGVFGFRPSWGRIPVAGVTALAPSFDTVGWLARDAPMMLRVGQVLLGPPPAEPPRPPVFVPLVEGLEIADDGIADALRATLRSRFPGRVAPDRRFGIDLAECARIRGVMQSYETWQLHGGWAQQHADELGTGVRARLLACAQTTRADYDRACADRDAIAALLDGAVEPGEVLCLPAAPGPAPSLSAPLAELDRQRVRLFRLMAPAGLWGAPQLSVPACTAGTAPVGLGLITRPGEDLSLLPLWNDAP
ncbi:amidase [Micromonospora sp. U21]|uniref:amidase n=1 Tax=Micromonospora sp. U21 TaxID=2824899 RepID=UPI001B397BAC|nr:amidase [Micromonospora sp. U21]MBQ0905013.1 amidase [Micromonospora sp. U21]